MAAVAGYAAGFLLGAATNRPFAANGVADRLMEATPVGIATMLLSGLGPAAKPFALAGALALVAGLGAACGALYALRPTLPAAIGLAAVQAAVVAKLSLQPDSQKVLIPYVVWGVTLVALSSRPCAPERRWFLRRSVQAVAGLVLLSTAATWTLLAKTLAGAQPGRRLFDFEPPAARGPDFAGVPGLSAEVTPVTSFYLMSKTVEDPAVAVDGWRLRVQGLVKQPLELTYERLLRLPRVDQWQTLRCVSNPVGGPLIGNALWSGVPLPSLLSLAELASEATTLVLKARDGYSDSLPLDRALLPATLVAYAMDGDFLNRDHGFPARVLVPGLYGFKNVKWVEELELVRGEFEGPWQRLGWTRTAIQSTFSRIDFVRRASSEALAGGIAFAGDRGISGVEVRVDDEPWRPAELHPPLGALAWTQWLFPFEATGRVTLAVRATDGAGALQEQLERPTYPNGATGWHTVTVEL